MANTYLVRATMTNSWGEKRAYEREVYGHREMERLVCYHALDHECTYITVKLKNHLYGRTYYTNWSRMGPKRLDDFIKYHAQQYDWEVTPTVSPVRNTKKNRAAT